MAYVYKIMTQDEQDEIAVSRLLAQERDKHLHEANLVLLQNMITAMSGKPELSIKLPNGSTMTLEKKYQNLYDQTVIRLAEVNALVDEANKMLPSQTRIDAAKTRLKAKQT